MSPSYVALAHQAPTASLSAGQRYIDKRQSLSNVLCDEVAIFSAAKRFS